MDVCKMLVLTLIISRLDYGNSLLAGLPKCLLQRLQRVQNSTARLITCTARMDHVTPILRELHWLPVQERVQNKVGLPTKLVNCAGAACGCVWCCSVLYIGLPAL